MAAVVLGSRKGSRLHRALVRERQVAAEAQAFTYDLTKGADLLVVDVTARPEVSAEQLEQEVAREVDVLHDHGVTKAEVERAIALIQTDTVRSLQSAAERADRLSLFATYFGDPSLVNEQLDHYRNVTAADVTAFAREYLGRDNRASLLYVPRHSVSTYGARRAVREETGEAVEASA
jgi:predicted Zn-dependent peptidase